MSNKIIVIVGTTASGKTNMAVDLAYNFNGEIISADSRQVYKGMDIGTGKDLPEYNLKIKQGIIHIPYHLIDVVNPNQKFNLNIFINKANKAIKNILSKEKLPIIAGGTGLYVQALVDGYCLDSVGENNKLRKELNKKNLDLLKKQLKLLNKEVYKNLNNSDKNNKRRLIRLIEINKSKKKLPQKRKNENYDFLLIGLTWDKEILHYNIYNRLIKRLKNENMVEEVENLHKNGLSWNKMYDFGLEYRYISLYLQNKLTYQEMIDSLFIATKQFAKRQITWLKRWERQGQKICWLIPQTKNKQNIKKFFKKNKEKARLLVKNFLLK